MANIKLKTLIYTGMQLVYKLSYVYTLAPETKAQTEEYQRLFLITLFYLRPIDFQYAVPNV
jgi:hypothetical protein